MDITHTAQLAVFFIQSLTCKRNCWTWKPFMALWEGRTCVRDLFHQWKIELTFEELSSLTTIGAPVMVGSHKGSILFIKKELNRLFWSKWSNQIPLLSTKKVSMHRHCGSTMSGINFFKSREFKDTLNDLGWVQWSCLSRWSAVAELQDPAHGVLKSVGWSQAVHWHEGKTCQRLNDSKWLTIKRSWRTLPSASQSRTSSYRAPTSFSDPYFQKFPFQIFWRWIKTVESATWKV